MTQNVTFVRITPNITRFDLVEGKYINRGMPVADVEHWVGHSIDHFHVAKAASIHDAAIRGHDVVVFRPHVPERVVHGGPVVHENPFFTPGPCGVGTPAEVESQRRARDDYYNHIDADMRARHEAELKSPPPNVTHDEMVHRQDDERRFLDDQRHRDGQNVPPPQVLRHDEHR